MSNKSGSGCGGWGLAFLALLLALVSLGIIGGVAVDSVEPGADYGALLETLDLGGVLVIVAIVALGMARREER